MLFRVRDFCDRVESDLSGLVDELQKLTGRYGAEERAAWERSLPRLSAVTARPALKDLHLHLGQSAGLALEYRLPASSSWCDAVLLGRGPKKPCALILELKDWDTKGDHPGPREGLIEHRGDLWLHPSDQVRGYAEYCQYFHSAIQDATVAGCVFFSRDVDTSPYEAPPHDRLTAVYPIFRNSAQEIDSRFIPFIAHHLQFPDEAFAAAFENGGYVQNRNFVLQVSKALKKAKARPFVLLDEQRRGYELCMNTVERILARRGNKKAMVLIEGPPGSGKSVIAAHLWASLSQKERIGSVVLTTTSGCQRTNWEHLFTSLGYPAASGFVKPANSYNPGLSPKWVKGQREEGRPVAVADWRSNLALYAQTGDPRVPDNSYAVSIVDEAHALIDPTAPRAEGVPPSGWAMHAGPQAWHIMRCSRVSVFLMDSEQSYRDNETTTRASLEKLAREMGVELVASVSLSGAQFRCGGSREYVEWVESLLGSPASAPHPPSWRHTAANPTGFAFNLVGDPQEMEERLREHAAEGSTVCLVANYAREWKTKGAANPHQVGTQDMDFCIPFVRHGKKGIWSKIWNYAPEQNYSIFIQRPMGTRMHEDPLCEVGCPYVVRGFDFDFLGVLWLSDLVYRKGKWVHQINHIHESAWPRTKAAARGAKSKAPSNDAVDALVQRLKRGYRILLTRSIRGVYVWVEDQETREHIEHLLGATP